MKKKEWIALFLICFISVSLVFCFYKQKQGLFLDETYTYLFVGGNGFNYDGFITDTWQDASFYQKFLTIQDQERFNLKRVFNNNYTDVHPPVYFLLFSIFLSFFSSDNFSVLSGIMFNLLFHIAIIILLYKFLKRMTSDSHLALIVTLMYAINLGTISNVLYIRMYELTTFWVVLSLYLHQKIISLLSNPNNQSSIASTCSSLALVNFLGILTHYHYLIFIIIIAFFFNLYFLLKKEYRNLFSYDLKIIMSILLVFIVFPNAWNDILYSNVGTVSITNFFSHNILSKVSNFLIILNRGLFANNYYSFKVYLGLLILSIIFLKIATKKAKIFHWQAFQPLLKSPMFLIINMSLLSFLLFLAITIPYQSARYVYIVYPLIIISISLFLYYFFNSLISHPQLTRGLIITLYILTIFLYVPALKEFNLSPNPQLKYGIVDNLFLERKDYQKQLAKYQNSKALVLTFTDKEYGVVPTWHTLYYFPDYLKLQQININYFDKLLQDPHLIKDYALNNDNLFVFLYGKYNDAEITNYLLQVTKFTYIETMHENEYESSKIYLLHK